MCEGEIVGIVPHCVVRVCDSMVYKVEGVTPIRLAFWGSVGPRDLKPAAIRAGACVAARQPGWARRVCVKGKCALGPFLSVLVI